MVNYCYPQPIQMTNGKGEFEDIQQQQEINQIRKEKKAYLKLRDESIFLGNPFHEPQPRSDPRIRWPRPARPPSLRQGLALPYVRHTFGDRGDQEGIRSTNRVVMGERFLVPMGWTVRAGRLDAAVWRLRKMSSSTCSPVAASQRRSRQSSSTMLLWCFSRRTAPFAKLSNPAYIFREKIQIKRHRACTNRKEQGEERGIGDHWEGNRQRRQGRGSIQAWRGRQRRDRRRPGRQWWRPPASPSLQLRRWVSISRRGGKRAFAAGSDGVRRKDLSSLANLIERRARRRRSRGGREWTVSERPVIKLHSSMFKRYDACPLGIPSCACVQYARIGINYNIVWANWQSGPYLVKKKIYFLKK